MKCDNFCCNPDADPDGPWCMVEDPLCEDSDWGHCVPNNAPQVAPAAGCADVAEWHDTDGDGCDVYDSSRFCTQSGGVGPGWNIDWGNPIAFAANGYSAFTACCGCGGGISRSASVVASGPTAGVRYTYAGCKCALNWEEEYFKCEGVCCNPFDDAAGDWCVVEDQSCEQSSWGYCRGDGANPDALLASSVASSRHGHCTDTEGWEDNDGEGCEEYAAFAFCSDVGGYGLGWNLDWGSFASFAADGVGGADKHCCACGGGVHDALAEQVASYSEKARTTWSGCECKETWKSVNKQCDDYCCNPDDDILGVWCKVKDPNCEDADWGYCQTSGLGAALRPMQDAGHCRDVPGWTDADSDGCEVYALSNWCTPNQGTGNGWHDEWGKLGTFKDLGYSALTACCACGGGQSLGDEVDEQSTMESLAALVSEETPRMWRVASGPCKMDDHGCITSGNYPKNYGSKEQCQIIVKPELAKPIQVVDFHTEATYDAIKINGKSFSGSRGPNGIVPSSTIFWGTDAKDQQKGWKLCPRGEGRQRKPGLMLLKGIGVAIIVILCCCCGALVACWIHVHTNMPHGDGLGAGPTKVGKSYAKDDEEC